MTEISLAKKIRDVNAGMCGSVMDFKIIKLIIRLRIFLIIHYKIEKTEEVYVIIILAASIRFSFA